MWFGESKSCWSGESYIWRIRQGGPERIRPGGLERIRQGGPERIRQGGPERIRPGGPERIRRGAPERIRRGGPERIRRGGPERIRSGGPERIRPGGPERIRRGAPERVRSGGPERIRRGAPERVRSGGSETWRLVFKVHRNDYMSGYESAADFLTTPGGSSETSVSVMTDLYSTGTRYRSTILDNWGTTRTISAVRLAVWDNDVEKAYFTFSTMGKTLSNWMDYSKSNADAVTLSVMEWYMVFKGIEGVTPSAGSLQSSWEGDTVENDAVSAAQTLTTSPSSHYKDGLAEIWTEDFTLVEQVKYAFFNDGEEKAYVVFKAMDSTKTSFFSAANIIASKYTDLSTSSPLYCSIAGDTIRHFTVTDAHGIGCTSDYHWMLVMDAGVTNKPCGFDQDVTTRPYFLYSSGTTSVNPDSGESTWNSAGFPSANVMGLFVKGWFPVMKVAYGQSTSPASSIYYLWISSSSSYNINEFDSSAYSFSSGTPSYRSRIVENWTSYYISAVRISLIKSGAEVAFFVFDAHASSRTDWLSCSDRLLYSSYSDLNRGNTFEYCSVSGDSSNYRRFFIHSSYGGCDVDNGWMVVAESSGSCTWESTYTSPYALYSDTGSTKEVNSGTHD
ncbi:uncharacterized protein LOC117314611 [Pecten maximus]|uniref:uncharacterized protein LOC117314611 n=1 Tax=Pecten maximus TaxID=6579 RepID=UPI0014587BB3|nr:uncharacterized protein LOC117314611 [Pecten maximus]